jgi:hypothetical protein
MNCFFDNDQHCNIKKYVHFLLNHTIYSAADLCHQYNYVRLSTEYVIARKEFEKYVFGVVDLVS